MSFYPTTIRQLIRPLILFADVIMPRSYVRKSTRQSWSPTSMLKAVEEVTNGNMGWLRASKLYGVPQATLRRHALNKNKLNKTGEKQLVRFRPTFSADVERQLVEHIKLLESRFFGLTRNEVLELAYQLAVRNGFPHFFNNEKKKQQERIGCESSDDETRTYPCANQKPHRQQGLKPLTSHKLLNFLPFWKVH